MRVGLVGENPNDTDAIKALLRQRTGDTIEFFDLIKNVNGSNLENQVIKHRLRREYQYEKVDLVLA
jgi:hypothetical protein